MSPWIIALIVLVVLIAGLVALYIFGDKMQKKQMAQKEQMMAAAQPVSMLIIDKKFMKMDQTPKRYQNSKLPIVKAKVGPQIMTLIADDAIFDNLPTKGEVKAMVSGIYIVQVKSIRGKAVPVEEGKKKSFGAKLRKKQTEYQKIMADDEKARKAEKEAKAREKAQKEAAKKIMK